MKIPFTPVIYEHAARFVGRTPYEVSRDAELMFEAHRRAYLEYRQQVIAVGIDIYNLEAEAYGAVVEDGGGDAIPAIREPRLTCLEDGLALPPYDPARDGRIPLALSVAKRLKREFPDADVRVPVSGPFSIAFNLRGIDDLCLDVAIRPEETARFLMRLAEHQAAFCRAIAGAGLSAAFFESAAAPPILSPRAFHEVELPALRRILSLASECLGHPVPCIMGGNTYPILGDLLATGTGYLVCNVETDQAAFVEAAVRLRPEVKIRVNLESGAVASPDRERLRAAVDRILALTAGRPQCVMGTGALPLETPPENVHWIREYVS